MHVGQTHSPQWVHSCLDPGLCPQLLHFLRLLFGLVTNSAIDGGVGPSSELEAKVGEAQSMVGEAQSMVGEAQSMVGEAQSMVGEAQFMVGRERSEVGRVVSLPPELGDCLPLTTVSLGNGRMSVPVESDSASRSSGLLVVRHLVCAASPGGLSCEGSVSAVSDSAPWTPGRSVVSHVASLTIIVVSSSWSLASASSSGQE